MNGENYKLEMITHFNKHTSASARIVRMDFEKSEFGGVCQIERTVGFIRRNGHYYIVLSPTGKPLENPIEGINVLDTYFQFVQQKN